MNFNHQNQHPTNPSPNGGNFASIRIPWMQHLGDGIHAAVDELQSAADHIFHPSPPASEQGTGTTTQRQQQGQQQQQPQPSQNHTQQRNNNHNGFNNIFNGFQNPFRPSSTQSQQQQRQAAPPPPQQQQQQHGPTVTPPASAQALRQLPTVRVAPEDLVEESNRECSICLEDNHLNAMVTRMPCAHIFHSECILDWLTNHHCTCPVCRYELPTNDPFYEAGRLERMKHRKPRFAKYELQRMSIGQLKRLIYTHNNHNDHKPGFLNGGKDPTANIVEKSELIQLLIDTERVHLIPSPEPVQYHLSVLQAMGVGQLKRTMEDAGVFFERCKVVEKSDMVTIFQNSGRLELLPEQGNDDDEEEEEEEEIEVQETQQQQQQQQQSQSIETSGFRIETVESEDEDDDDGCESEWKRLRRDEQEDDEIPIELFPRRSDDDENELVPPPPRTRAAAAAAAATSTTSSSSSGPPSVSGSSATTTSSTNTGTSARTEAVITPSFSIATSDDPSSSSHYHDGGGEINDNNAPPSPPLPRTSPEQQDHHDQQSFSAGNSDLLFDSQDANSQFADASNEAVQDGPRPISAATNHYTVTAAAAAAATTTTSRENELFQECSIGELQSIARQFNVDLTQCVERREMVQLLSAAGATVLGQQQPLSSHTLSTWSVSQLRAVAVELEVDLSQCTEKEEMIQRLVLIANDERPHLRDYLRALSPLATSSLPELRAMAREWKVNIGDCLEKDEIISRLVTRGQRFGTC